MTEAQLRESFLKWRAQNTPPGTRIDVQADSIVTVRLTCAGQVPYMAYWCSFEPEHKGPCYSAEKGVYFRANYMPATKV